MKKKLEIAEETDEIMSDYLRTLLNRVEKKTTDDAAAEEKTEETVDFDGFGTKHASFLLKTK